MLNSKDLCLNSVDKNMETNCKLFKDSYDCGTNFLEIYKCRYCNFRTDFRIYITGHYKNVHLLNKDPEDVIEYSKIRCCGECDLTTYSMLGFAKHKLNHEQVYNACKCKSPTQNSVTHTKFFDEYKCDTVKYECIECSYKTSRFSYIYKHTKKRHISNIQYSDHLKFKKHCTTAYKCTHCSSTTMDYAHFKRDFQRDYTAVTRKNGYLSLLSEEAYPKHEFKKSDCEKPFSYIPGHFCDRAYLPSSNKRKTVRKNKSKRVPIYGSDDQPDIPQHKNLKISIKLKITDRKLQDLNANSDLSISENLKNSHSVDHSSSSKLDFSDGKLQYNAKSDLNISENLKTSNSVELSTPSKLDITDLKFEDNANSNPSISENVEISNSVELSTFSKLDITDRKFEDNANSDPSISENVEISHSVELSTPSKLDITDLKFEDDANTDPSISENLEISNSVELSTPSKLDITDLKFEDNANSNPSISENVEISNSVELSTFSKLDITDRKFEDNASSDPSISENVEISHSVELSTPSKLDITDLKFEDNANSDPSISENVEISHSVELSTPSKLDITDLKFEDNANSDPGISENVEISNSVELSTPSKLDITDLKFEDNANSDPSISENVEISHSVELSTPSKLDITDLKFEDNANSDPSISENVEISHSVELSTPSKLDITDLKFEDNANSDPSISENLKSSNSIDFSTSCKLDITDRKLQDNPNSDLGMSENLKSSNSVNLASISSINSDSTTQIKKIRSNKKHLQFCLFCKSNVLNFARHVTRNHSSEMMVKKIVSLPRKNPKRKKILELLRKKGNFANRVFVQRPVRNPIINKELLPCDNCYGFYSKKLLWKHRKACLKGKSVVKAQVSGQNLLTNNLNIDKDLKETVFSRMRPDEISLIAKKDPLICAFASRYIKKHHRENSVSCVTRKMRELAKLLMELTKQYPEIENLFQCLKPELFDAICAATKVFAKWDDTTNCYKMPTYVSQIRFTIKRCCQIATTFAGNKADTERDLKTLIQLVDSYWDSKIYPHTDNDINFNLEEDSLPNNEITPNLNLAQSELKVKVGKKRILIPWTEEQKRVAIDFFSDHIKNKKPPREGECAKLREQTGDLFENKNWLKIKVFIQNQYTKYRK